MIRNLESACGSVRIGQSGGRPDRCAESSIAWGTRDGRSRAMSGVGTAQGRGTEGTTMAAAAAVACGAMGVRDSGRAAIALLYEPTC